MENTAGSASELRYLRFQPPIFGKLDLLWSIVQESRHNAALAHGKRD
jgi:hypothetical protein